MHRVMNADVEVSKNRAGGRLVCLGAFAGAHGVRGEIKVRTFTETEENISAYGPLTTEDGARRFTLRVLRVLKPGLVLAKAAEIRTREDAEALARTRLYVPRGALPAPAEGEFYIEDLIGLAAVDEEGARLGEVVGVHNFGAGDILEVSEQKGASGYFVPFSDDAAPSVDLVRGEITILGAAFDAAKTGGEKGEEAEGAG
jgi:16S rRNA processing protein RimM